MSGQHALDDSQPILHHLLVDIPVDALPPAWTALDPAAFSPRKRLYDYQQEAVDFALRALWLYYSHLVPFVPSEPLARNEQRKRAFLAWLREHGLTVDLDIPLPNLKPEHRDLLLDYFPARGGVIPGVHFVNRVAFWMATGSGKTIVLVKLVEVLWWLARARQIPANDILVLTHRDILLDQIRAQIEDFNTRMTAPRIRVHDLREYSRVRREWGEGYREDEVDVFLYRSDNLGDEQKERILDFRNYDNHGRWYVLLDEAHKGDREESKRRHIYSILSRNGFLFNFSATFTDPRDIAVAAYNFNLARFVTRGYAKHIVILRQDTEVFRRGEDFSEGEKQRLVLKALLVLALVHEARARLRDHTGRDDLYHRPLMLTLVHSVNTRDADLKRFFRELERIARGDIAPRAWQDALADLRRELAARPRPLFESHAASGSRGMIAILDALTPDDLLRRVFNAETPGEIEVWVRPSNRQEMAFKLKSAAEPFALVKVGDIGRWLQDKLDGYDVLEGIEDEGFFQRLNAADSPITILMGSRTFYEGWDSNRPNVIMFINIGTGVEARKFILQSVGRGVRVEPLPGFRERLAVLAGRGGEPARAVLNRAGGLAWPVETLFLFAANRAALHAVITHLDMEGRRLVAAGSARHRACPAPIPRTGARFPITREDLALLRAYVDGLGDDRLLLVHHAASPSDVARLRHCLAHPEECFTHEAARPVGDANVLLAMMFTHFARAGKEA